MAIFVINNLFAEVDVDDLLKAIGVVILLILAWLFFQSYGFAKDHHIETGVVFNAAIFLAVSTGVAIWVASQFGITEGFCIWLILSWVAVCPVLAAIAEVNPTGFSLSIGGGDPAWYGVWWFRWGVGFGLVALSGYLLHRKHAY
ncbi:hypothetical protein [Herbaspirillum sp. ST 5-3]|uniref:hypothetical protein n=1 Tax=Oxalobacteraceae TaxID=75682 RepID=UPI0010A37183|nr:hypothetical protein [Herbaspirillum sp. ST 5-3]